MSSLRSLAALALVVTALSSVIEAAEAQPEPKPHLVELRLDAQRHRFTLARPAGVVLLLRLTLPRGTRAYLTGRIGSIAGVGISTDDKSSCRVQGRTLVCEQGVEWCPLPRGTWGFRLHKLSGPAGTARLDFVIGTPPR